MKSPAFRILASAGSSVACAALFGLHKGELLGASGAPPSLCERVIGPPHQMSQHHFFFFAKMSFCSHCFRQTLRTRLSFTAGSRTCQARPELKLHHVKPSPDPDPGTNDQFITVQKQIQRTKHI
jgi:hypothetical protein